MISQNDFIISMFGMLVVIGFPIGMVVYEIMKKDGGKKEDGK